MSSTLERVAERMGVPRQSIAESIQDPPARRQFKASNEWRELCGKMTEGRWEHLMDALNAQSFDEKEFHRGFVEALQWVMELPDELFKEEEDN